MGANQQLMMSEKTAGSSTPVPDLVWLKMTEGSGTALANSAVPSGANFTTNAGWSGASLTFNGTNQYAQSDSAITMGVSKMTVTGWWNFGSIVANQVMVESGPTVDTTKGTFLIYRDSSTGKLTFGFQNSTNSEFLFLNVTEPSGQHLITIVFEGDVLNGGGHYGAAQVWYDTTQQSTSTISDTCSVSTTLATKVINIGERNATSVPYNGALDDFRMYAYKITSDDITALYNAGPQ